jgi:hypothetical protein
MRRSLKIWIAVHDDGQLWYSLVALDEVSQHRGDVAIGIGLPGLTPEDVKVEVIDGA